MTYALAGEHLSLSQLGARDPTATPAVGSIIYVPAAGGGWAELVVGSNGQVLTVTAGVPAWAAPVAVAHNLLSATHTDTTASAVSRGDLVVGTGASPAWDDLVLGASGTYLGSDGTDALWRAQSTLDHGSIGGLADDDHTQYALLAGRSGGQTLIGGTASGDDLKLQSTSHATPGDIRLLNPTIINNDTAIIGTPTTHLDIVADGAVAAMGLRGYGTAVGGGFRGIHANTSLASPSASVANDILFFAGGHGHGGAGGFSSTSNGALFIDATETHSGTARGTQIRLNTTTNGATATSTRLNAGEGGAARVHIIPSGTADVELEVSNGASTGGGTIHRATSTTHSSRTIKSDIDYLPIAAIQKGLADVVALRHATFRYMRNIHGTRVDDGGNVVEDETKVIGRVRDTSQPIYRGLIYEDAPASIRAPHETISIDDRITNLELAIQALVARLPVLP